MFATWITGIVGISVIGILIDIVVKSGETEKYVKGVFGLFTLFVIVSPLPNLLNQSIISFEEIFDFNANILATDSNYVEYVYERKYNSLEDDLKKGIESEYGVENEVDIYFVKSCPEKIDRVYIILKKEGIREENENTYISVEIENAICNALELNEKRVIVEWKKTDT